MAGLPEVDLDAVGPQRRIGLEQPGRLDVDDEGRVRAPLREVARQHDPDLVGEDLGALVVDDAAAVAVAVEAERDVGAGLLHRRRHRMQHLHIFGVRIVVREGEVEIAVERNDLDAELAQELGREGAGRAVAAGGDDLEPAAHFRASGQIGDVAGGKIGHEFVSPAGLIAVVSSNDDVAQPRHLLRPERHRPRGAHLDAGPAVVVVRGGHHRHRRRIERELGEIGHRRDREPDVAHLQPPGHQPGGHGELDRGRIAAEVVADDDLALDPKLRKEAREAEPQRLRPHQVDLLLENPARIIFAKPGRLDHWPRFIGVGVGQKLRRRLGKQGRPRVGNREPKHRGGATDAAPSFFTSP